jgi:hypothetical protein
MTRTKIPDEDYNKNWRSLLAEFHDIDHKAKDAKEKYTALKEKVNSINPLTISQSQGIKDRCNNAINGTYNFGDMAKSEAYDAKANKK